MEERGSALLMMFAVILAILAGGVAMGMRLDLGLAHRRHDELRIQAKWLARSAARNPGSHQITLDRGATASVTSVGGTAAATIPGVGTARVVSSGGAWRETFDAEKR